MSTSPQTWDQLLAAFQQAADKLRASSASAEDEAVRTQLNSLVDQLMSSQSHVAEVQQRDAEFEKYLQNLAREQEAEAQRREELAALEASKKAVAVPRVHAVPPKFDPHLGEGLKRSLFEQMGMPVSSRRAPSGIDHRRDIEQWAKGAAAEAERHARSSTDPARAAFFRPRNELPPVSHRHESYNEKLIFVVRRLPRREAVWWVMVVASDVMAERSLDQLFAKVPMARPVYEWLTHPDEEHVRLMTAVPDFPGLDVPAGCVARAIMWKNRPTPEVLDIDDPKTTAEAVVRAILLFADIPNGLTLSPPEILDLALERGREILEGRLDWNERTMPAPDQPSPAAASWDEWINDGLHGM